MQIFMYSVDKRVCMEQIHADREEISSLFFNENNTDFH